jgi:hypothetical protein
MDLASQRLRLFEAGLNEAAYVSEAMGIRPWGWAF